MRTSGEGGEILVDTGRNDEMSARRGSHYPSLQCVCCMSVWVDQKVYYTE